MDGPGCSKAFAGRAFPCLSGNSREVRIRLTTLRVCVPDWELASGWGNPRPNPNPPKESDRLHSASHPALRLDTPRLLLSGSDGQHLGVQPIFHADAGHQFHCKGFLQNSFGRAFVAALVETFVEFSDFSTKAATKGFDKVTEFKLSL
jgi:hypothetical protein